MATYLMSYPEFEAKVCSNEILGQVDRIAAFTTGKNISLLRYNDDYASFKMEFVNSSHDIKGYGETIIKLEDGRHFKITYSYLSAYGYNFSYSDVYEVTPKTKQVVFFN